MSTILLAMSLVLATSHSFDLANGSVLARLSLVGKATSGPSHDPDSRYVLGPDSQPHASIGSGRVLRFKLAASRTYRGFEYDWWLYIPAHHDSAKDIPVMVFLDGRSYVSRDGRWRVPVVLDNLIAQGSVPPMAAVFIEPGHSHAGVISDNAPANIASNRSVEYDTLNSTYASFLIDEILPLVREQVRITDDPGGYAIAGHSSGGICAFTVAWQRPDQFRKVFSANGSFTNIRGGNVYPALVRKSSSKPIRIFQQGGKNDLVNPNWGDWWSANKAMAEALHDKGYDHTFVFGDGTHSPAHAASIFPEAMRWLWRDYPR